MKNARTCLALSLLLGVGCAGGSAGKGRGLDSRKLEAAGPYSWRSVRTGAGGGFIVDVLFNPKEKDLIYGKTDMGGVYRWNPATRTWKQLLAWVDADNWGITGPESVATDPVDPNRLYIAGGTYTNSWDPKNGVILRSTDRGETFKITPMPFKMGGNMPGRGMGERLAVDPNQNSILFFGARDEKGLWKSTDFGETWSRVANFPDGGPYCEDLKDPNDYLSHAVGIPWVIFDPRTSSPGKPTQTIYVGVAQNGSEKPNVYRSTDGGATWAPIPGQPTCKVNGKTVTCTGGAKWDMTKIGDDGSKQWESTGYLPKQGKLDSTGTLYLTYSNFDGPYKGNVGDVWKFVPSTSTWTRISPVPGSAERSAMYWGYGGLGVDLQRPGTLVVAAVNCWWPEGNMWRTTDGGATWKPLWEWAGYPNRTRHFEMDTSTAPWLDLGVTLSTSLDPKVKVGWMMEGLNIDPFNSDRMMYGTGATLYATENLTAWDKGGKVVIKSLAVGMEETSVLGLVSPPAGTAHLYSVVGDVGGWRHDDLDTRPAKAFTVPYSGTFNDIDFAELKPEFMVRVGTGNPNAKPRPFRGAAFTVNAGDSWSQGKDDPVAGKGAGTVAVAADGSSVVWAGVDAPVSYTTDRALSWKASAKIPRGATVASDRVNAKKFYGFGAGKFWLSTDGGATFSATAATGLPASGRARAVFGREGDVWLTGGTLVSGGSTACDLCGVWHSTDAGTTFTKLAKVTRASALGFGMAQKSGGYPAVFVAGTVDGKTGIFRSDDAGTTWNEISDPQHHFATVQTITGDPRVYGRVYVGTNGLGILYGDLAR